MKNLLFLALFLSSFVFSQQTINQVVYKKKIEPKKVDSVKLKKRFTKSQIARFSKLNTNLENILNASSYTLLFDKEVSLFFENPNLESENLDFASKIIAKSIGNTKGKFYIDVSEDSVVNQRNFGTDLFRITSKLSDKNWKIDFDTSKKIGDYTCYKATGIQKLLSSSGEIKELPLLAWFATELPYPFGPADYGGLPGLILELHIKSTIIYADKITLNKKLTKKEQGIKPLKKGILLSSEEYVKMQISGGVYKRPKR